MYIVYGEKEYKTAAINDLKEMYKHYNLFPSKVSEIETKEALKEFISNQKGYKITLNLLYYSLLKAKL